jgi:hypothetical protein
VLYCSVVENAKKKTKLDDLKECAALRERENQCRDELYSSSNVMQYKNIRQ